MPSPFYSAHFRLYFLFLTGLIFSSACGKKKDQTKPKVADITESVYASARIKAENQYTIFPNLNGSIKTVYVEVGDTVSEGQILFRMDDITANLNAENAQLALNLSKENAQKGSDKIKELEINLAFAKEKIQLDTDLLQRQKSIWAQGVGSKAELDQRQLAFDNSKANLAAAKSKLDQVKFQLKNDLDRAKVNFAISKKQKVDFTIRSVRSGRLFDLLKKEGELVGTQTPLAIVGDANAFLIEMEVDQADITKIKIGQDVLLTMDSYKDQVFGALVSKVYPIMEEKTRTFKVEAKFKKMPVLLYPNLTAEANIIIFEKKNAITIPRNYLVEGKYVLLGKDEKREVKVGLKDYQKVEVLSGIDSSTVIYRP